MGWFQRFLHDAGQVLAHGVQVHGVFQPGRERGHGLVGVCWDAGEGDRGTRYCPFGIKMLVYCAAYSRTAGGGADEAIGDGERHPADPLAVAWLQDARSLPSCAPLHGRSGTTRRDGGLATASSTIYNVGMAIRAMQEATFLILTALADGSQHGYGIIADVQDISGGQVQLRPGTLYTALDRLRADELIEVDREEVVDGRLRRYYRLTPEGTTRLGAEAARLQAHAAAALTRLDLAGGMAT